MTPGQAKGWFSMSRSGKKCPVGKTGTYPSLDVALDELRRIRHESTRTVKPIRAYLCHLCRKWHLTSQRRRRPGR